MKLLKKLVLRICPAFLMAGMILANVGVIAVHAAESKVDNSVAEGVVAIRVLNQEGTGWRGSGFFVGESGKNPQYIVTNCHVINHALADSAYTVYVAYGEKDMEVAEIVAYGDVDYVDLAVLKIENPTDKRKPLKLLKLDQSTTKGLEVWALGFPGNADNDFSDASRFGVNDVTFASGAIKRFVKNEGKQVERIAVSCEIQHGHSGGPLINADGYVVGVNTNVHSESPYENQIEADYYAINTSELITFLDKNNIFYELADNDGASDEQEQPEETLPVNAEVPSVNTEVPPADTDKSGGMSPVLIVVGVIVVAAIAGAVLVVMKKSGKNQGQNGGKTGAVEPKPQTASAGSAPKAKGPVARSLSPQHNGLSVSVSTTPILVGRDKASCAIAYVDGTAGVSGRHCSIAFDLASQSFVVTDLGSTYGTFLMNGQRLQANVPCRLKVGNSFYVGDKANVIRLELG